MKRLLAHSIAALGGAAAWIAACRLGGHVEAWDGPLYTEAVLPGLAALLALLGFWVKERPAALGIAASFGQMIGLAVTRGGEAGAAWPVGVGILCAVALPLGLSAWLGSGLRRMLGRAAELGRSGARLCCRRRRTASVS